MEYCKKCGTPITPGVTICRYCGVPTVPTKSRKTAIILAFTLGMFGAHNFYLGYTGKAIAQIVLSLCFGAGAVWGLIEGILILCGKINKDAKGNPLKD